MKTRVQQRAEQILEQTIKPLHLKPPPEEARFNYIGSLGARWRGKYFYFYADYICPSPDALFPSFEAKFARMEWAGLLSCIFSAS